MRAMSRLSSMIRAVWMGSSTCQASIPTATRARIVRKRLCSSAPTVVSARTRASARFWYVSEEKLEPRLGERYEEPGAELEQPLAVGRDVASLDAVLGTRSGDETVAAFLLAHPALRHVVRRVQIGMQHPYAEIRDNLIGAAMRPIDLLRCKLSFFGATRFDPRSDRWVRITLFQNAPYPDELATSDPDDWAYPPLDG